MEFMMISRSVEISITGGVEETDDGLTTVTESSLYKLFTPTTLTLLTDNKCYVVLLHILNQLKLIKHIM